MSALRTLFLKSYKSLHNNTINNKPYITFTTTRRRHKAFTTSATQQANITNEAKNKKKRSLLVLFQEAVGLSEPTQQIDTDTETRVGNSEYVGKLVQYERELKELKKLGKGRKSDGVVEKNGAVENGGEGTRKAGLEENVEVKKGGGGENVGKVEKGRGQRSEKAGSKEKGKVRKGGKSGENAGMEEKGEIFNKLSPDMEMFVTHLYKEGYFSGANFVNLSSTLDFCRFDDSYGRCFIKFAAENFGKDHQSIAKWLSGSDLKRVALFGCPSHNRKSVFPAKSLRKYFEIPENNVCSRCVLKDSCNFANQTLWNSNSKNLDLATAMRIIILYALEAVHPELTVPVEVKASISRLLAEVVKLSQTTS